MPQLTESKFCVKSFAETGVEKAGLLKRSKKPGFFKKPGF
jgi:hypothetical protein